MKKFLLATIITLFLSVLPIEIQAQTVISTSVELDFSEMSLTEGKGGSLNPQILPADASDQTFSVKSSNEDVAVIDENGRVTAVGYGTCTVTVESGDKASRATCEVNVYCTNFTLEDNYVVSGSKTTLVPKFKNDYKGITNDMITWSSSDNSVATVDNNGVVTAKSDGMATISGILLSSNNFGASNNLSASCTYTVSKLVNRIEVKKSAYTLYGGQSVKINAVAYPEEAYDTSLTYSSDKDFVSVNESGVVETDPDGNGTATVTITTNDGSKVKQSVSIKVIPVIHSISFAAKNYKVEENSELLIPISINTKNTSFQKYIVMEKTLYGIAGHSFTVNGGKKYLKIKGLKEGSTTLTLRSASNPDIEAAVTITVTKKEIKEEVVEEPKNIYISIQKNQYELNIKEKYATLKKANPSFKGKYSIPSYIKIDGKKYPVTKIGKEAFKDAKKITSFKIPGSVKVIDNYAFTGCTGISSITIPKNVTYIGTKAFYNCKNLKKITIKSDKIQTFGKSAFKKIAKKSTIYTPKKVYKQYKKMLKNKIQQNTKIKYK